MGEHQEYACEFEPHCHQLRWLRNHLGGWQFGEHLLIPTILDTLHEYGLCIEVGAGNGESLPLTIDRMYGFIPNKCMLIEIDDKSREALRAKYPLAHVSDKINWRELAEEGKPISVVVIDIDGRDSVVMQDMLNSGCRPALIVCEHMDRHYSQPSTSPSLLPEWVLGAKLQTGHIIQDTAETLHWMVGKYGYERAGLNRCNSFFVRKDLFPKLFKG